ncbi:scavenger receptor cysteine-rich domain-containing group B protein isoform X1 [Labeo rohita]|uniref:scavenger receptor cysteine-rich domain-containing group B protein isoform X1 n=1 Tax=Labeo rohita TaxID=84645 RepID=UPI0021E34460|nr:scavenger receptor cysteine-rich domain-containing group B protein isoform X1 [Labeo rohita]
MCLHDMYAGVICQCEYKTLCLTTHQSCHALVSYSCVLSARIRLVSGINSCSGRVEVLYNGTWGTVCDDDWGLSEAAVVCREIGCGDVIEAKDVGYFGEGSGQIWMDDVNCTGNESALSKCKYLEWGENDCDHSEDAGVICQSVIRLVEGFDTCSGRVEVLHNKIWGTVCDYNWSGSDAAVVCKEVGCGNFKAFTYGAYFGATSGQIWMDNVNCNGEEAALSTCEFQGWGTYYCLFAEHAGVICGLPVRLKHGNSICSGRVEVLHDGLWGTVSDDGWNLTDAAVVCRELGCGDAIQAKSGSYFGQGSGPVWMDSVDCTGNESSLIQCKTAHWQHNDLDHLHDAGVICSEFYSTSGGAVQGAGTSVKVLLRIEVKTDPMFDPNDARTMSKLSEEMEKKLQIRRPFSLTWKTQKDGKVFQEVSQKKKSAGKCN